jgi:hypothetical protein
VFKYHCLYGYRKSTSYLTLILSTSRFWGDFGRRKFFVLQWSWIGFGETPHTIRWHAVAPYIQQSTRIGSVDGIWRVLGAFLLLFWGTAATIRHGLFFYIQIIPFSPTFVSLFRLKICRIFVFDCWKVPAVLLCVLVDVLSVFFQSTGIFWA